MTCNQIHAILFDFDGTLTQPGAIDFQEIKKRIGCPPELPILEFIDRLPDEARRRAAHDTLTTFEAHAAEASRPDDDAADLLHSLKSAGFALGILTRNQLVSVETALKHFDGISPADFDLLITREDPHPPKPAPDGVHAAAAAFGVSPDQIMVVGDFHFDIIAGNRAGAVTVWLDHGVFPPSEEADARPDHRITRLSDLQNILALYRPLPAGKFPNEFLKGTLARFPFEDPSVIINPGIGEDIAAVEMAGEEVLILKSDPITFATDAISRYAVLVNANDIATAGALPRWMLTTLLFPPGSTARQIDQVITELESVCRHWGITLCGGHTEVTDAVTRPVVAGMIAGTVRRADLIDKRAMRPGDMVLLTKGVAVEGTSIIAREFSDLLLHHGMPLDAIRSAQDFLSLISILDEARIAAGIPGTHAMHDVTEGGLATALSELSIAGGHRIQVRMESIPVYPQTEAMCRLLELDPLGVIGSGSLLICCAATACRDVITRIHERGIMVTVIGEVGEPGEGVTALSEGHPVPWPAFETDEIARLFSGAP